MTPRRAALLALALAACVAPRSGPDVVVDVAPMPEADADYIRRGASSWREIGFEVVDASELPDCPRRWYELGELECRLFVAVDRADLGDQFGGLADRSTRRIVLTSRVHATDYGSRIALWSLAAHEFGHVLLDTGDHLPDGAGVMSPAPTGPELTEADLELACAQIGACP